MDQNFFKTWPVIIQTMKAPMKVYSKPFSSSKGRQAVAFVIREETEESHRETFYNTYSSLVPSAWMNRMVNGRGRVYKLVADSTIKPGNAKERDMAGALGNSTWVIK